MTTVDRAQARRELVAWLKGLGMPTPAAEGVVDHVLAAEVIGRRSHGLRLLPWIARGAAAAEAAEVTVEAREPGTLTVEAGGLPGIYAIQRAVDEALRAHADGRKVVNVAVTGFVGTTGCLGLHVRRAAEHGCTGLVAATSPSIMAPPGTITATLGTNALALAAPVAAAAPLVVDFSSGAWSYGDVALAQARGTVLPDGVVIDRSGAATTDPKAVMEGSILPSGGHRGWSQALLVEALAGAAVGGKVGRADGGDSAFVLSIGPDAFGGAPSDAMAALVEQLLAAEPGPEGRAAHIPGERFRRLDDGWERLEVEPVTMDRLIRAGGPRLSG